MPQVYIFTVGPGSKAHDPPAGRVVTGASVRSIPDPIRQPGDPDGGVGLVAPVHLEQGRCQGLDRERAGETTCVHAPETGKLVDERRSPRWTPGGRRHRRGRQRRSGGRDHSMGRPGGGGRRPPPATAGGLRATATATEPVGGRRGTMSLPHRVRALAMETTIFPASGLLQRHDGRRALPPTAWRLSPGRLRRRPDSHPAPARASGWASAP